MHDLLLSMFKKNIGLTSNWLKYVKQSLDRFGLSFIWLTQGSLTPDMASWFKTTINERIRDQFISDWHCQVQESQHCVIFRMYKTEFCREMYF